MKKLEIFFGIIKIPFDYIATLLAFVAAYHLRLEPEILPGVSFPYDPTEIVSLSEFMKFGLYSSAGLIALFAISGLYTLKTTTRLNKELGKVLLISLSWIMLIIVYFFMVREFPYSRLALAYTLILTVTFIGFEKILIKYVQNFLLKKGFGQRRTLIIGKNKITSELVAALGKNLSYKIVGILAEKDGNILDVPVIGTITELEKIAKNKSIDEIIQTEDRVHGAQAEDILDFCREHHIHYSFVPDLLETQRSNIEVSTIQNMPLISLKPTPLDGWGKVYKRIFDIFTATIGLIIVSPILLITAIAIKIDDPKSTVLFKYLDDGTKATRIGQHGKKFHLYKFRSMKPGTHSMRYQDLAEKNLRKTGPLVKIKDDPRITKVGSFIRKTTIDELPSLWNVLKGDMSLVGPRPHLPEEVEKYQKHHKFVLTLKPGATGIAQVSGRSDLDFEEEVKLDTYYIEHWSIWMDIKIILKTFTVLGRGYKE